MNIVSFTGAQSTGKTTLLDRLKAELALDKVEFVEEVTRKIKREYGVPINEDGGILTQHLISAEHLQNALRPPSTTATQLRVLDRCSLDGMIYAGWFEKNNDGKNEVEWIKAHRHALNVFHMTKVHYDIIFYTEPGDIQLEDDGERSVNVEFRDGIIKSYTKYLQGMNVAMERRIVKLRGSVEERIQTVKDELTKLCGADILNR